MRDLNDYLHITSSACDHHAVLGPTKRWICDLLGQPNVLANKTGPICPGIPAGIKNNSIYLRLISSSLSHNSLAQLAREVVQDFLSLSPIDKPACLLKAVFLVLATSPENETIALVDSVHRLLKADFLGHGILFGKFHSALVRGSIYNPDFNPHRSPVPLLAFRYVIETDLDFLLSSAASAEVRAEYIEIFIELLSEQASLGTIQKARQALHSLKNRA